MGMALLERCRVLLVCGDEITEGMSKEIKKAEELGIDAVSLSSLSAEGTHAKDSKPSLLASLRLQKTEQAAHEHPAKPREPER